MTERWRERLAKRGTPAFDAERIWTRIAAESESASGEPTTLPSRGRRIATALVAFAVFVPVALIGWFAFRDASPDRVGGSRSDGVLFPTWEGDARPSALVGGVLVEHDRCLFLRSAGEEHLALWEHGYSFADGAIVASTGDVVARVGDAVTGGGGYGDSRAWVEKVTGVSVPDACVPEGAEPFLMIYDVTRSSAPESVVVPDVTGLDPADARRVLSELGLTVERRVRSLGEVPVGVVAAQEPAVGTSVAVGSAVTLTISTGPTEDVVIGDLPQVGIAVSDAGGLTLIDVDGNTLASLPGFEVVGNAGAPGLWLRSGREYFVLDPAAGKAIHVSRRYARSRMYDESMVQPDLPPPGGTSGGHWRYELFAPVGGSVLAQWSGECEVPTAYWIDAQGRETIVTGEASLADAPESFALGWTPDGAALVFLPAGACGGTASDPGIYRFSAPGSGDLIFATGTGVGALAEGWDVP